VALGTVRQVLNRLQSEGWISSHRGKGSFVRPRGLQVKIGATVGLAAFGEPDVTEPDLLLAMRAVFARHDIELMAGVFSSTQVNTGVEWARPFSGVMAWGRPPLEFIQGLLRENIPTVLLGNMHEEDCPPQVSQVNFSLHAAVDQAIQFLASQGHRRILFINRGGDDVGYYARFLNQLSLLTGHVVKQRIPDATYEELAMEAGEVGRLIAHLQNAALPPTALFFEGGQRACRLMHELEKASWSVPGRLSAIGLSPLRSRQIARPDLSYVELPMIELATRGAEVMLELLRDRRIVRESISPVLHWGKTCCQIGP